MSDKSQFQKAKKCCFKKSRKVENELNDISQDFDNRSTDSVDRLFTWFIWAGLKYSYDYKIKNNDEKHLNFLEIEYEAQYDKIFKREDISFQTIA